MTRSIAVVTGTRAEYGLLRSTMRAIRDDDRLELQVVVTGMHLSPRHGRTVDVIEADGFVVDRSVHMLLEGDTGRSMAKSLGIGLSGMADALGDLAPDVVLVLGDRDEAFAAGVAAAHMNVPVAHVHGGDSMQGAIIDDSIRHALTKFAHVHFPATETSARRIERLGEDPSRITVVGAPGLDDVLAGEYRSGADVREALDLDPDRQIVLVVQHPLTTDPEAAGDQMRATLQAATDVDAQRVVIFPNSDAGGDAMIDVIESFERDGALTAFENVPRETYLGLLDAAAVLVGNSSSGIIEAPSFGLPVVDVGPRQDGRERADNVVSVPHERSSIQAAIDATLNEEAHQRRAEACESPYDRGGAAERIVGVLRSIELDEGLLRKQLTYDV